MIQKVTILVLLAFVVFSLAQGPGALLSVSQNGINTVRDIVLPRLIEKLKQIKIPDVHEHFSDGRADIENVRLTDFQLTTNVNVQPGVGFTFLITNLVVSMWADWHVRFSFPPVRIGGTADATISQTTVKVTIAITVANGRPKLSVTADNVVIGDFHLRIHGNKVVDFVVQLFKSKIKHEIEKGIHDGILEGINEQGNQFLQQFPFLARINQVVELDYSLPVPPTFGNGFTSFPFKGEIKNTQNPVEYPIPPPPLPVQSPPKMLQIIVSEYTFGSGGFAYWRAGRLHTHVNNHNIPPNFPIRLNTSDWKYILPGLYKAYPNLEMQIDAAVSQASKVVISPAGIDLTVQSNLVLSVIRGSVLIPCVTLAISAENNLYARLDQTTLIPSIKFKSFNMKLINSTVGPIGNVDELNKLISSALQMFVIPYVNSVLATGFPLPVIQGKALVNPSIAFSDHYLIVDTDFRHS
jgi:lipopolysaccharide-binding protein